MVRRLISRHCFSGAGHGGGSNAFSRGGKAEQSGGGHGRNDERPGNAVVHGHGNADIFVGEPAGDQAKFVRCQVAG